MLWDSLTCIHYHSEEEAADLGICVSPKAAEEAPAPAEEEPNSESEDELEGFDDMTPEEMAELGLSEEEAASLGIKSPRSQGQEKTVDTASPPPAPGNSTSIPHTSSCRK